MKIMEASISFHKERSVQSCEVASHLGAGTQNPNVVPDACLITPNCASHFLTYPLTLYFEMPVNTKLSVLKKVRSRAQAPID